MTKNLIPVMPQLHEEKEDELAADISSELQAPNFYLGVEVSSFEKRRSRRRIDQGTYDAMTHDDEYRAYFRQLRNATMNNPIDYIERKEAIDCEWENGQFACPSKFIMNNR